MIAVERLTAAIKNLNQISLNQDSFIFYTL